MISLLRLRNFKSFADQTIRLSPMTLLAGLNGMGKSSVLQAMLLLRQSYQLALLPQRGLALNGTLATVGAAKDAMFEYADEEKIGFELRWNNGLRADWSFAYSDVADVMNVLSEVSPEAVFQTALFNDDFQYLQAERLGPRVASEISDFQVRQHRRIGPRGEYAINFLAIFGSKGIPCEKLRHPKADSATLSKQVEAWLGEVSPGVRLEVTPYPGIDQISLKYAFGAGGLTTMPYRATNVGFGLSYTLPILLAVLSSGPDALVLLENPEAHLHPKGQVQMGKLLAYASSCGIQIIVETHSDHLLNGIRLAVYEGSLSPKDVSLNFFERRAANEVAAQTEIASPRIDRNGRIDYWPDGFFDEWDKSLEALLMPAGD